MKTIQGSMTEVMVVVGDWVESNRRTNNKQVRDGLVRTKAIWVSMSGYFLKIQNRSCTSKLEEYCRTCRVIKRPMEYLLSLFFD